MLSHPRVAVVLVATNDTQGKFVRWASNSRVNHAMIVYEDPVWGGFSMGEANMSHGVVMLPFDPEDPRYLRTEFFVSEHLPRGLPPSKQMFGAGYDYPGAIIGTTRLIFRKFLGTSSDVSIHDHEAFFCFEFCIKVLQNARIAGAEKLIPENTSPAMFRQWIMEHEYFKKVSMERFMESTAEYRSLDGRQPWQRKTLA